MPSATTRRTGGHGARGTRPAVTRRGDTGSLPSSYDWRTTDEDEIEKRRLRAMEELPRIRNLDAAHPIFSNFDVHSPSGMRYSVEIRDLGKRHVACTCVDFRHNGLGTCKHVEAVLLHLECRYRRAFAAARRQGSARTDIVPDPVGTLRVERNLDSLPASFRRLFLDGGLLRKNIAVEDAMRALDEAGDAVRLSQEIAPWLESRRRAAERVQLRREYEARVQSGEYPPHETMVPLYPYQRQGMLHLAFTERALLADEMGLGKTIQAIAACALLHRLGKAQRILVVTPASLKTEWEEQIQRFTPLPYQLVFGNRRQRLAAYGNAPFFTVVNYEQMVHDSLDVNAHMRPDIVVLDEAQRIKNWNTKTAQAIKRLQSRYAFVLTGTPLENRIDELYSIVDFLDPNIFGPLFQFNREFYALDDRGRPSAFKDLRGLHERVRPVMLRRRKADVETELPDRTDRVLFVPLSPPQEATYEDHYLKVARLISQAKRRPLTQQEHERLMREMNICRMICDTNYILDAEDKVCPKLDELKSVLESALDDDGAKAVIFSEWVRMLELVRDHCRGSGIGFAWHTGSVPQRRRRAEILLFRSDPACRVFLTTDSGGVGLNLQHANVVINCDLPWNPARLEQRIARVWRKHQTRPVTVINLVSERTVEHGMLATLQHKTSLADGVLELKGDLSEIKLKGEGRQTFFQRLEQIVGAAKPAAKTHKPALPVDRAAGFADRARAILGPRLVSCEERFPDGPPHSVLLVVVDRDAPAWQERLKEEHDRLFGHAVSDPLAPVLLDVIDRATHEALERLTKEGLIQSTIRATRHLHPGAEGGLPPLSEADRQRIAAQRDLAARKLKMARLLLDGDLREEALPPLREALLALTRAHAITGRLPEPESAEGCLTNPWLQQWGEQHAQIQTLFNENPASAPIALAALDEALGSAPVAQGVSTRR